MCAGALWPWAEPPKAPKLRCFFLETRRCSGTRNFARFISARHPTLVPEADEGDPMSQRSAPRASTCSWGVRVPHGLRGRRGRPQRRTASGGNRPNPSRRRPVGNGLPRTSCSPRTSGRSCATLFPPPPPGDWDAVHGTSPFCVLCCSPPTLWCVLKLGPRDLVVARQCAAAAGPRLARAWLIARA